MPRITEPAGTSTAPFRSNGTSVVASNRASTRSLPAPAPTWETRRTAAALQPPFRELSSIVDAYVSSRLSPLLLRRGVIRAEVIFLECRRIGERRLRRLRDRMHDRRRVAQIN